MNILFKPTNIKNMELRNRFVRSATCDCLRDETGYVSEKQIKMFIKLAHGGEGLIIKGITYVHHPGQILVSQKSIASDDCTAGLKRLTTNVQDQDAKIALQLFHGGKDQAEFLKETKVLALAPSFISDDPYFPEEYRSMTEDEIWDIISAFGDAARRAREAEFDAVQLHAAHAFLPS
jgi:2,4-dienoyl-CoA reductase-like NADH-dependent reductase (Old Yellow Enzyme family)